LKRKQILFDIVCHTLELPVKSFYLIDRVLTTLET